MVAPDRESPDLTAGQCRLNAAQVQRAIARSEVELRKTFARLYEERRKAGDAQVAAERAVRLHEEYLAHEDALDDLRFQREAWSAEADHRKLFERTWMPGLGETQTALVAPYWWDCEPAKRAALLDEAAKVAIQIWQYDWPGAVQAVNPEEGPADAESA